MTVHIPTLLEGILEATAAREAANARITTFRAELEVEARRRLAAEGAAPSWNAPELGKVRLDPPSEPVAIVTDATAFGSHVAEYYPSEATLVLKVKPQDAGDVLKALEFVGIDLATPPEIEVRDAWSKDYLSGLAVDVELNDNGDRIASVFDTASGVAVPGVDAEAKPAKLVVSLDRTRKTLAVDEARAQAEAIVSTAVHADDDTTAGVTALDELDARRKALEALTADQLTAIAKGHGLTSSGTKAALAERIARTEAATGNVIRPASTVEAPPLGAVESTVAVPEGVYVSPSATARGIEVAKYGGAVTVTREEVERAEPGPLDVVVSAFTGGRERLGEWAEPDEDEGAARTVDEHNADEDLSEFSREVLRAYAKAIGVPASGTKDAVITRLIAEGVTAAAIRTHAGD